MKKIISMILVLVMLLSVVSCNKNKNDEATVQSTVSEDELTLPQVDLGGEEINIYVRHDVYDTEWNVQYDGDQVNEAIFLRNKTIEEKMNTYLNYYCTASNDSAWGAKDEFATAVRAGHQDGSIDLIEGLVVTVSSMAVEGLFVDLLDANKVPHLDLDKEYWPEGLVNALSYKDSMYLISGEANPGLVRGVLCFYFNKTLINNLQLENPYELVESKQWTLDKMYELSSVAYIDRGDQGIDAADQFGFMIENENHCPNFLTASDIPFIVKDEDGSMKYNLGSVEVVNLIDQLNVLVGDLSTRPIKLDGGNTQSDLKSVFTAGNALFMTGDFSYAQALTASEVEYGVLPYPKQTVEQNAYYTSSRAYSLFAISSASPRVAGTSAVLEAMAYFGRASISPAFFERGLQLKYSADEVNARMFDIIRNGIVFDIGDILGALAEDITPTLRREIAYASGNWTSTWEKKQVKVDTYLQNYLDGLDALKETA